ncbi:hypothetical protein J7E49_23555, partial [Variovorax paradoxus]|nr:hypothetical protein [Variovorax paradoxus]
RIPGARSGSTLDTIGSDLNKAYQKGRDKILDKAAAKVADPDDGKKPNLRVARDVLWNGAITDDEVCAEYFGGILAASRTDDGTDDGAMHYLDVIKSLSSKQLHLHYCIYFAIQRQLREAGNPLNVGQQAELGAVHVFLALRELQSIGLKPENDLTVLHRVGLLAEFQTNSVSLEGEKILPYSSCVATTFGCMLYAVAFNKFESWRGFATSDYGTLANVRNAKLQAPTLDGLIATAGLKPATNNVSAEPIPASEGPPNQPSPETT